MSGIQNISTIQRATNRGTRIIKKGQDLDKNAFLKILTAELSNQDPTNSKDSTQFISQLAQFSSLEQMTNLNETATYLSASSLVGKLVSLNDYDNLGIQYRGKVQSVSREGGEIKLNVEVVENGKHTIKEFPFSKVKDVINFDDNKTNNKNGTR